MKLIAICPVRNEAWVCGASLRSLLMFCDELIVLDHASTDATPQILSAIAVEHPGRVLVLTDDDPTWREMAHRQRLLEKARERKATHIVTIDADELVSANLLSGMRNTILSTPPNHILQLPWVSVSGSRWKHISKGPFFGQFASSAFRDHDAYHWRARDGYDFHHRHPMGRQMMPHKPIGWGAGGLLHLQFLSGRRLRAKSFLYQLTEVLRWPGRETPTQIRQKYSLAVYGQPDPTSTPVEVQQIPEKWWSGYEEMGLTRHIDRDSEPWQLEACKTILDANPGIEKGLDDHGLFSEPFYRRA